MVAQQHARMFGAARGRSRVISTVVHVTCNAERDRSVPSRSNSGHDVRVFPDTEGRFRLPNPIASPLPAGTA
jgi:hypothetical protein